MYSLKKPVRFYFFVSMWFSMALCILPGCDDSNDSADETADTETADTETANTKTPPNCVPVADGETEVHVNYSFLPMASLQGALAYYCNQDSCQSGVQQAEIFYLTNANEWQTTFGGDVLSGVDWTQNDIIAITAIDISGGYHQIVQPRFVKKASGQIHLSIRIWSPVPPSDISTDCIGLSAVAMLIPKTQRPDSFKLGDGPTCDSTEMGDQLYIQSCTGY